MVHDFVRKLVAEVQTLQAIQMYNNHKSFDEIAEECDQVWSTTCNFNAWATSCFLFAAMPSASQHRFNQCQW